MTDTPAVPPVDPWSLSSEQAAGVLSQMQIDAHPPAPLAPTTPAEARARLNELTSNKEWGARLIAGHVEERREFARLTELANQADEVKDAIDGTTPQPHLIETVGPGELSTRDQATTVAMFRDAGLTDDVINQAMRGGEVGRAEYMAAKALKSARHGDAAWCDRFLKGGWAEGREALLMNVILTSEMDESR
jgi:hypothetical protein